MICYKPWGYYDNTTSDGIRGKMSYERGFHVWKIHWQQPLDHAIIGVATKEAPLEYVGKRVSLFSLTCGNLLYAYIYIYIYIF